MSSPFAFDWDAPLTDTERDTLLERIANGVKSRGLQAPAVWFLEVHKPLAPLGGQLGIAFSPFLGIFFGAGAFDLQKYTKLMQTTGNIDRLIHLIDAAGAPPDSEATP